MELTGLFISYRDLAKELGVSYDTICNKIAPNIISEYNIDKRRLIKKGCLPVSVVSDYFDFTSNIEKYKQKHQ